MVHHWNDAGVPLYRATGAPIPYRTSSGEISPWPSLFPLYPGLILCQFLILLLTQRLLLIPKPFHNSQIQSSFIPFNRQKAPFIIKKR